MPSAVEYVNVDRTTVQLRQKPIQTAAGPNSSNGQYHPMTRHTLQVCTIVSYIGKQRQRSLSPIRTDLFTSFFQ